MARPSDRQRLWLAADVALRSAFPDRGRVLRAALEDRLEPGPWSVGIAARDHRESRRVVRDPLLNELARAFEGLRDGVDRLRALETWHFQSPRTIYRGYRAVIELGYGFNAAALTAWAARACEAGIVFGSVQALAEADPGDREGMERLLREVELELAPPTDDYEDAAIGGRIVARELLFGRGTPLLSASMIARLVRINPTIGDPDEWNELAQYPNDPAAITDAARALLSRPV